MKKSVTKMFLENQIIRMIYLNLWILSCESHEYENALSKTKINCPTATHFMLPCRNEHMKKTSADDQN